MAIEAMNPQKHIVYRTIKNITEGANLSFDAIRKRVHNLTNTDIESLLDEMDLFYDKIDASQISASSPLSPFTIWIPSNIINKSRLSAHFLISDKIIYDDPLIVSLNYLTNIEEYVNSYWLPNANKHTRDVFIKAQKDQVAQNLFQIIKLYLESTELISEGRLFPYFNNAPQHNYSSLLDFSEYQKLINQDPFIKKEIDNIQEVAKHLNLDKHNITDSKIYDTSMEHALQTLSYTELIGSMALLLLSTQKIAPSVDLLNDKAMRTLKSLISIQGKSINKSSFKKDFNPVSSSDFPVASLCSLPPNRILDLWYKEQDTIEYFKREINSKIGKISAAPGSKGWDEEISAIRANISKDFYALELSLKRIKKSFIRATSADISLMVFSVGVGVLATAGNYTNLTSTIGAVASGAGLMSALKGFVNRWLSYKKETDFVKGNPLYFLWTLNK